jgi:thiol:disulfide interchange protein DsbC
MKKFLFTLVASLAVVACNAQQPPAAAAQQPPSATTAAAPAASSAQIAEVQKMLEERFKGAPIRGVRASVIPGIYEAVIGDDMIHFDPKLSHFIVGNLIDAKTMTNLTEDRISELSAIDVKQLPLDNAIKFVRGKGERVMYVFTDVDCPFCTRLEQTIQTMDNVTVYNFMFPIDSLHPAATNKQKSIWCAKDRLAAWQDAVLRQKHASNVPTDCKNPVDETKALGAKLGVRATPSFFLADGRMVAGALPKEKIEERLNAVAAKLAATK